MKKLIIAAVALSAISAPAFAANNNSVNARLNATVPLQCELTANDTGGTVLVNTAAQNIGSITALCNDVQGFVATASSRNSGALAATDEQNTSTIPYTLNIQDVGNDISLANDQSFPGPAYVTPREFALQVNTSAVSGPAYAGRYTDVITFSIQNN